jgi:hypothetical protein
MRPNPARGFGNLIGRGVGGQIRLDGEQFGSFSLSVISTRQDRVERRRGEMIECLRTQWWRERDETLTDIAGSYNIKAYGVKEDAALPKDAGTVFVR